MTIKAIDLIRAQCAIDSIQFTFHEVANGSCLNESEMLFINECFKEMRNFIEFVATEIDNANQH